MSKPTPSPWLCHPCNSDDGKYCVWNADGDYLTVDEEVHAANAALIARAPDLLNSLVWALDYISDRCEPDFPEDISAFRKSREMVIKLGGQK